jgi:hypothetical protein
LKWKYSYALLILGAGIFGTLLVIMDWKRATHRETTAEISVPTPAKAETPVRTPSKRLVVDQPKPLSIEEKQKAAPADPDPSINDPELREAQLIRGYDGIPFGTKLNDIPKYLNRLPGVNRGPSGDPMFARVPGKTYFAYNINRSRDFKENQSEVSIFVENGVVSQIKDSFGGPWIWDAEEADEKFDAMAEALTARWGPPERTTSRSVHWVRDDGQAVLTFELPSSPHALQIINLLMWES